MSTPRPPGPDPFEAEDPEDSWEPPDPDLWAPLQLIAAVLGAFLVVLLLLGAAAAVSWFLRLS